MEETSRKGVLFISWTDMQHMLWADGKITELQHEKSEW